ncbi:MAG: hypothetical protein WBK75_01315 [Acutalibacteraceae bacterium]|jgi:hypothetical protein|nr:hypothetical protein [Clostridiales bacterium]
MVGIGKWQFSVNTIFYKGSAVLEIKDNNGKYAFNVEAPGMKKMPDYFINNVKVNEKTNTLLVTGGSDMLPGKEVEVRATFNGDRCDGYVKVPFLGKVAIKDGKKIG